jgi:hypothetical protein
MKIKILAQDIMDAYYQDFKSHEDFFELDYFVRQVKYVYDELLKAEYERRRQELRQERAAQELFVSFDESWLQREEFELEGKTELILKHNIFSFPFNTDNSGVQDLLPLDSNCIFARTTESGFWKRKYDPTTNEVTWWYVKGNNKIALKHTCTAQKAAALYVAEVHDDLDISGSFANAIQTQVLTLMFGAKNGNIINETNDGNKNKTIQTESNSDQVKP